MTRLGVITNPTAGSGRGLRWGSEAMTALSSRGYQLHDLSRGTWAASYEAAMKHRRGLDGLIVVGGDGMVHLGVQVCAHRKLPLGIVATGSGNDAAQTLGLPIYDIEAAVSRIAQGLEGAVATIDLGAIWGPTIDVPANPRYFVAVLSAGIDAAIAAYAANLRYPRGPLKYKVATLRELPRFKPYGVSIKVDGKQWSQECTLIAVANSPMFGGGLIVSPDSRVTDGRLELVLAEPLRKRDIVKIFPKLYDGSHVLDPRVRVIQATKVEITPHVDGARLPAAFADGELVGQAPMTVKVAAGALRVLGGRPARA